MRKLSVITMVFCLMGTLLLAGCSNNKVSDGVNKMLDTTAQLSKAIDSGDQAKVKELGPQLEKQWSSFEDNVKKDNKDLYEKVEKYLDPTVAGTGADTLDKKALSDLNNQLIEALKELK